MSARGTRRLRPVLAFLALFSGIALLLNIVLTFDLRVGLLVLASVVLLALIVMIRRADSEERRVIAGNIAYGAVAGIVATLAYDVARTVLTALDPSPYRPFEAIIRFGQLLLGTEERTAPIVLAGALYHALNGSAFGVAFAFLFVRDGGITVRRAFILGMAWGLFLELFQIALYPDWLNIKYYDEFVTISAFSHVAYGATLGPVVCFLLRRGSRARPNHDNDGHAQTARDGTATREDWND